MIAVSLATAPHRSAPQNSAPQVPVSVIALRAEAYSPDDQKVVISLRTKYSGFERAYSVPLECFHDLVVDLQRLNALTGVAP